jgi:hypothetical protein
MAQVDVITAALVGLSVARSARKLPLDSDRGFSAGNATDLSD